MPRVKFYSSTAIRGASLCAALLSLGFTSINAQSTSPQTVQSTSMAMARTNAAAIIGTVYDSEGEPLPGAAVITDIKGLGALTDADGKFIIKIPKGTKVTSLTASYVGMQTMTLPYESEGKPVDFVMQNAGNPLNEVVVTGL